MSKKFGKFLLFSAVAGAAAYGAYQYLQKKELDGFMKLIGGLTKSYIAELYADVSKYCSMYDYRSAGKDADWGNSKDSIERAIGFLTSRKP